MRASRTRHRFRTVRLARCVNVFVVGRRPDALEHAVQAQARLDVLGKLIRRGDDRLQRRTDILVSVILAARQGAAIAAEEG